MPVEFIAPCCQADEEGYEECVLDNLMKLDENLEPDPEEECARPSARYVRNDLQRSRASSTASSALYPSAGPLFSNHKYARWRLTHSPVDSASTAWRRATRRVDATHGASTRVERRSSRDGSPQTARSSRSQRDEDRPRILNGQTPARRRPRQVQPAPARVRRARVLRQVRVKEAQSSGV